jgi:hypothetical protein
MERITTNDWTDRLRRPSIASRRPAARTGGPHEPDRRPDQHHHRLPRRRPPSRSWILGLEETVPAGRAAGVRRAAGRAAPRPTVRRGRPTSLSASAPARTSANAITRTSDPNGHRGPPARRHAAPPNAPTDPVEADVAATEAWFAQRRFREHDAPPHRPRRRRTARRVPAGARPDRPDGIRLPSTAPAGVRRGPAADDLRAVLAGPGRDDEAPGHRGDLPGGWATSAQGLGHEDPGPGPRELSAERRAGGGAAIVRALRVARPQPALRTRPAGPPRSAPRQRPSTTAVHHRRRRHRSRR